MLGAVLHMDVPKKRIPRAEFHGIFMDIVECGIAKKWNVRITAILNKAEIQLKFHFLDRNTDFHKGRNWNSTLSAIPHTAKLFHGIRFLGTSLHNKIGQI